MNFKKGDKIRITKNSNTYNSLTRLQNKCGIIISTVSKYKPFTVNWEDGQKSLLYNTNTEYWYMEPLREFHDRMDEPEGSYEDWVVIRRLYRKDDILTKKELQVCRDLWEKYNKK
ncbi:hypothetical protein COB55_05160 [Candidatus Wolfebacteria bacterium]|nr:MAG: hypothetical protein COB55_05160 [Candidatus Wolfebacteria bacterium]